MIGAHPTWRGDPEGTMRGALFVLVALIVIGCGKSDEPTTRTETKQEKVDPQPAGKKGDLRGYGGRANQSAFDSQKGR